jgi:hypothetical protein
MADAFEGDPFLSNFYNSLSQDIIHEVVILYASRLPLNIVYNVAAIFLKEIRNFPKHVTL